MNQVSWYKFEIDGKRAMVIATSMLNACSIIQSEYPNVRYTYIGKVE